MPGPDAVPVGSLMSVPASSAVQAMGWALAMAAMAEGVPAA